MDIQQNNIGIATMVKIECYNLEKVEIQKIFLNVLIVITKFKDMQCRKTRSSRTGHSVWSWFPLVAVQLNDLI